MVRYPAADLAPLIEGIVEVIAVCRNGRAERVSVSNVPSFADRLAVAVEVPGLGTLTVDIAYGGDSFVIPDAAALGSAITPEVQLSRPRRQS